MPMVGNSVLLVVMCVFAQVDRGGEEKADDGEVCEEDTDVAAAHQALQVRSHACAASSCVRY